MAGCSAPWPARRPGLRGAGLRRAGRRLGQKGRKRGTLALSADAHPADPHQEIRDAVRKLCAEYPGEYWRKLDRVGEYPTAFVRALTESGFLSALIPEAYGGAGLSLSAAAAILEEVQAAGCNGAACHAQMYVMGTVLRHGSEEQKRKYLPEVASGRLRLQAFGVTEPTSAPTRPRSRPPRGREGDRYIVNGQKIWTRAPNIPT